MYEVKKYEYVVFRAWGWVKVIYNLCPCHDSHTLQQEKSRNHTYREQTVMAIVSRGHLSKADICVLVASRKRSTRRPHAWSRVSIGKTAKPMSLESSAEPTGVRHVHDVPLEGGLAS